MEVVLTLLLWPVIGFVAYTVSPGFERRLRSSGLWIHVLGGPLMLVPLAWHYVKSGHEAEERAATARRARRR